MLYLRWYPRFTISTPLTVDAQCGSHPVPTCVQMVFFLFLLLFLGSDSFVLRFLLDFKSSCSILITVTIELRTVSERSVPLCSFSVCRLVVLLEGSPQLEFNAASYHLPV